MNYFFLSLVFQQVLNIGGGLSEHGVSDADISRSDIRLYLHIRGAFFGAVNELLN